MLKIYNSLTQRKELFKPISPPHVKMYVCGQTVYDYCHLGHARKEVAFDIIYRYLLFRGYNVTYVRNITDVDDKIIQRAEENHESCDALTTRFIDAMNEDFEHLDILSPNHEPRATQYIPHIVHMIEKLIDIGYAYIADNGDVYYDVRKFKPYGKLSHHNIDALESGARVDVSVVKKDPLDFVLWKMAKPGEPSWESPWGLGRPGWHSECSAMSMELLGEQFDIHGGGKDLIFPHHENEIAQSEALSGKSFANIWMHAGYLQLNKEKMSKSLGNFLTIRDILKEHSAEVLRYLISASHYRSPLNYSDDLLVQAQQALSRFYTALRGLEKADPLKDSEFESRFIEAMDDDFNTPVALSVLFDLAHEIQRLRENDLLNAARHAALLVKLSNVMGFLQEEPESFFKKRAKAIDPAEVEALIQARNQARADKNWAEADRIRQELSNLLIVLEDGPNGTSWKYIG